MPKKSDPNFVMVRPRRRPPRSTRSVAPFTLWRCLGVSISDSQVHLQPSSVQNLYYFSKIISHFEKLVQEQNRIGGISKGHQFAPLVLPSVMNGRARRPAIGDGVGRPTAGWSGRYLNSRIV